MAKFDKTFPTLDCAACILTPKMSAVRAHPNITLWTLSEVTKVDGYVGNYKVAVLRRPRYVDEDLCAGCLECLDACVYKQAKVPDDFNFGLSNRKPIYIAFPQAVPQVPVVDPETCIQFKSGKCKKTCIAACGERHAINLQAQAREEHIEVGTVILSTGFQTFDAGRVPYYGYGTYPNVYTALEVERLVNASGPTGGEVILRDGRKPQKVGIVHCVGSRDENTHRPCLGPATRAGCRARCINGNMPCTGCFGPTSRVRDFGAKALCSIPSIIRGGAAVEEIARIVAGIPDPVGTFYRYSLPASFLERKRSE